MVKEFVLEAKTQDGKTRCQATLNTSWNLRQCKHAGVDSDAGKFYCGNHSPIRRRAKRDAEHAAICARLNRRDAEAREKAELADKLRAFLETNNADQDLKDFARFI